MSELVHVTEVLEWVADKELAQWRGRVGNTAANKKSKEALSIGTALHSYIADTLNGLKPEEPKSFEAKQAVKAFKEWHRLNEVKDAVVEETHSFGLQGIICTPDIVCTLNGQPAILDWKTSALFTWKHDWQVNAYLHLLNINQGFLIRLDKFSGSFSEKKVDYDYQMWGAFRRLKDAYTYWKETHACHVASAKDNS